MANRQAQFHDKKELIITEHLGNISGIHHQSLTVDIEQSVVTTTTTTMTT
jgi:hypothetical protein